MNLAFEAQVAQMKSNWETMAMLDQMGISYTITNNPHEAGMSWLTLGANTMMPNVIKAGTGIANAAKNGIKEANLLTAANSMSKGGLTEVGRALQKHGSRPGSVFPKATGNPAAINAQGEAVLKSILENPNVQVIRNSGSFIVSRYGGGVVDYIIPNGMGARFSVDGTRFIGFLNP
jgi:hypothetical protein